MTRPPRMFGSTTLGRLLVARPLVAMDIGARRGFVADLLPIAAAVDAIGFEPDKDECDRLNRAARERSVPWRSLRFVPTALASEAGERDLHVTGAGGTSSMLGACPEVGARYMREDYFTVEQTVKVNTVPLDDVLAHFKIDSPAYMKVDVEGMEGEVFNGGVQTLKRLLSVRTEVAFRKTRVGQPLYHEIDRLLRDHGLVPFGFVELHDWRRTTRQKHPLAGGPSLPFSRGQLVHGDVIYFRDADLMAESKAEDIDRLVQLAALALCYDFVDEAAAILCREAVVSELRRKDGLVVEPTLPAISRHLAIRYRRRRRRKCWDDLRAAMHGRLWRR